MKQNRKSPENLPPIKVRHEPPTIEEALAAASDLSDDFEQRIEIAAGLMGISMDDVRPHAAVLRRPKAPTVTIAHRTSVRQVVVERKLSRSIASRLR
jgi:hypothetical protein